MGKVKIGVEKVKTPKIWVKKLRIDSIVGNKDKIHKIIKTSNLLFINLNFLLPIRF